MADVQDVLIVGGGAAGYTAGIFAARDRGRGLPLEKFAAGGAGAALADGAKLVKLLSDGSCVSY